MYGVSHVVGCSYLHYLAPVATQLCFSRKCCTDGESMVVQRVNRYLAPTLNAEHEAGQPVSTAFYDDPANPSYWLWCHVLNKLNHLVGLYC